MTNRLPSRRRAASFTLIGNYINIAIVVVQGLLLVPFYLKHIGPSLYGAWLASGDILGWVAVVDMGLASLMVQRIGAAYGRNDRLSISHYLSTGIATLGVLVILFLVAVAMISRWIPLLLKVGNSDVDILAGSIVLGGLATGLSILNNGVAGFAQALQRTIFMNIASLTGGLLGVATTLLLLTTGQGLWAIPIGWVVRDGTMLVGNTVYALIIYRTDINAPVQFSSKVLRDFITVFPSMFLAKLGGAIAGRSEAPLIAVFTRPELATVYVLTRRAADIVKMILDRFGAATFAGFANLIGTGQKVKARDVYHEVATLFGMVAVLSVALYLFANQTFMHLWVGPELYGGHVLTTLIGLGTLVSAGSSLNNYLYVAMGQITRGSNILLVEGLSRVGLMVVLLSLLGLPGLPLATILTGAVATLVILSWTSKELDRATHPYIASTKLSVYSGVLLIATLAGTKIWAETWTGFLLANTTALLIGTGVIGLINPSIWIFPRNIYRQIKKGKV